MRFLILFLLALIPFAAAMAADSRPVQPTMPFEIIPPINFDTARLIALQREPGNVFKHEIRKANGSGTLYEFDIQREDGTQVEIEILGASGEISSYRLTKLGPNVILPDPRVSKVEAESIAVMHVDKMAEGMEKPLIKETLYMLYDGALAWRITLSKFFKTFIIYINPDTGDILSVKQDK